MRLRSGIAALITGSVLVSCQSTREVPYLMTWQYENDHTCRTMRHVLLRWVDYPGYEYGYCSDQLAQYLDSRGLDTVTVTFSIYAPDAPLGGGDPIRVGELTTWQWEFAHMGTFQDSLTAQPLHHPWERSQQ